MRLHVGLALLLAVAATACQNPAEVVDGWTIGRETAPTCPGTVEIASAGLDRRDRGHAAVARATVHENGLRSTDGQLILNARSGGKDCGLVRFELVDGSVEAILVGTGGIDPRPLAMEYGPSYGSR